MQEMRDQTDMLLERTFELRDKRKWCEITVEEYERLMGDIGDKILAIQHRMLGELFAEGSGEL